MAGTNTYQAPVIPSALQAGWRTAIGLGNVTNDAQIAKSLVDAKGDIIVGTADNTPGRLAAGTNDYFLVPDSAQSTGLKWVTPAAARTIMGVGTAGSANAAPLQCGRLTLDTGVAITTADMTAKSTIYFTPWRGNIVSIYNGTDFIPYAFSELSRSISGLTSGKNYDVFAYVSSGNAVIDLAPAWTNDAARSAAISLLNGIYVNTSSFTPVMGGGTVAASQGTLVGTIRTTGTSTTEDSYTKRFVASLYNPVAKLLYRTDSTSHAYSSSTIRGWNNASTHTLEWVSPVPMHGVILNFNAGMLPSAAGVFTARVGLANVTTSLFASIDFYAAAVVAAGSALPTDPGNGYRIYYVTEAATGTNNSTFYNYVVHGLVMV